MAGLVTYRTDIPQDGRIRDFPGGGDFRVSILPTIHGEKAVVRIFGRAGLDFAIETLGFPGDLQERIERFLARPNGVLFLTGPSGSGKTTTIYALLRRLTSTGGRRRNIVTVEDPVEYDIPGVTQSQVNPASGLTFAASLRAVLRQDPEVIVIGEVRDAETARIAIEAGLTGHLVISTIHSGTACGVFVRLLDMGIEPHLLSSAIHLVVAQRLVRRLCPRCRRSAVIDDRFRGISLPDTASVADPVGCDACFGTGYLGRLPIGEVLPVGDRLRTLVLGKATQAQFERCALDLGMIPLWTRGLARLTAGETSVAEIQRVLTPPDLS
jgi:type II secretory ATPase GspE/PulE/Tfp pilus assembly ATPase PilB-like protein